MWPTGLHTIGGLLVRCHLLVLDGEAVLIDTGLVGTPHRVIILMERLGLPPSALRAILLTHGHLDHVGGLAVIKAWSGARVFAHSAEQAHMNGTFAYRGVARIGGVMEAAGRLVLGQQSVKIDVSLHDGDELPFWGGLRVIHLPGHTAGHCGFFSARANVLFSGDLFASYWFSTHRSPAIFTSDSSLLPASMARVRALNPAGLVPNHYDRCDAALHRRRFEAVVSDAG